LTNSSDTLSCPNCGNQIGEADYLGGNLAKTKRFYFCPKCKLMVRVEKL